MHWFDLKDISERYIELVNPSSPDKVMRVANALDLSADSRVIDFGCGMGETLALWGTAFGISGVGVELRPKSCERARQKLAERGLAERIEIVCMSASEYAFEKHAWDVAVCMGATFIWGGWRPTLHMLSTALRPGGRLVVGEPYWRRSEVPPAFAQREQIHTEYDLFHLAWQEGLDVEYVVRSSEDDWDRYEADNWRGLLAWLRENPGAPERGEVAATLRESQSEYTRHVREYFGWALYVLTPSLATLAL
ncbi:MAG: class I SAM-dependent methyltransferase [Anaerolineae bacterium]